MKRAAQGKRSPLRILVFLTWSSVHPSDGDEAKAARNGPRDPVSPAAFSSWCWICDDLLATGSLSWVQRRTIIRRVPRKLNRTDPTLRTSRRENGELLRIGYTRRHKKNRVHPKASHTKKSGSPASSAGSGGRTETCTEGAFRARARHAAPEHDLESRGYTPALAPVRQEPVSQDQA